MKKQKFSLLLNIGTICLSICAIAIGVYSVKTASLGISGSIDFTVHNCEVRVLGKVERANEEVAPYQETVGVGKVVSVTASTWEVGDITFDSSNR